MRARIALLSAVIVAAGSLSARAQSATVGVERLDFDRPEAWAMQYFTSVTFMSGLETTEGDYPGSVAIGLESGWIPKLTADQERVGFSGRANQDLNKAPILLRPRVRVGLPYHLALLAGAIPPVKAFDVTPRLLALGVEWTPLDRGDWRVAGRVHGQVGTITGAFTCPPGVVVFAPGSPGNSTGCGSVSSDEVTLRYVAAEVDASRRIRSLAGLTPHVAVAVNDIDTRFRVNALAFGAMDRTMLATHGWTTSISGGAAFPVSRRVSLAADVFYTPLMVRRDATGPLTNDGLFNVRGFIAYRVR